MPTLVISDLHLGTAGRSDVLRRPELRAPLMEALDGVGRLVVLGDFLELREVPVRAAAPLARDLLAEAGRVLGPEGEIVLVPGNHDHGLVAGWLEARLALDPSPLATEQRIEPDGSGPLAQALAEAARPSRLTLAYPGIQLRDDVYALHGHYSDLHTTVPTFERICAGAMARWITPIPVHDASADHYEAALGPLYAWVHSAVQRADEGRAPGAGMSGRAWTTLRGAGTDRRPVRTAALRTGFTAAVGVLNRAGVGPLRSDISGEALRQGGLRGMGEVLRRLGVDTPYVVWGHSHRAGPFPGDDQQEWIAPTGSRMINAGCWVYQSHFVTAVPNESPYWPGVAVIVDEEGPPRLTRLLGDRGHSELRPPRA